MRSFILAFAALLYANAFADRLIDIPMGRKITSGTIRLETRFLQADFGRSSTFLDYGIDSSWEGSLRFSDFPGERRLVSGDLSYNYIPPLTGVSPGLSAGVQDVANRTLEGRRAFLATTY